MITITNLTHCYGNKLLFQDVQLSILKNRRYALLGANGVGKTTFLKLLYGLEEPDDGVIQVPQHCTLGWQGQDQYVEDNEIIRHIVMRGSPKLWEAFVEREKFHVLEDWTEENCIAFADVEEKYTHFGGYQAEGKIEKILIGLGIEREFHELPLSTLSGGFKLRVYLARALFNEPDCLLLDEPTNHLDIFSIQWLEEYLKTSFSGAVIFISHDLSFVKSVATDIWDIDYGEIREYPGKYEKFEFLKEEYQEQKNRERKEKQRRIDQLQKFIDRFKAKATKAAQAKSKQKMLDKIELPDQDHSSRRYLALEFEVAKHTGKAILKAEKIAKAFGEKVLYKSVSFSVFKGDKLAIIGQNGIGKSTLLKILLGEVPADGGSFEFGLNTNYYYLPQNPDERVNLKMSGLEWLKDENPKVSEEAVRRYMGRVLFSGEEVHKEISVLSGGEKVRLLLADMMIKKPNLLILDEPTNHLDIESIQSLMKALKKYEGSLLVVSHNEDFLKRTTNKTLLLKYKRYDYIPAVYSPDMLQHAV